MINFWEKDCLKYPKSKKVKKKIRLVLVLSYLVHTYPKQPTNQQKLRRVCLCGVRVPFPCYGVKPIPLKRTVVLFLSSSLFLRCRKMGTLTNCTLLPLNSEFRFKPVHCSFRNKIHYNHRFNSHASKWGKLKHVHFDRFKCFSINNKDGVDDEGENGNKNDSKSNVTTVLPDEDRGFNPDKSTTPSTSQRVHFCLIHWILVFFSCLVASVVLTCYYLLMLILTLWYMSLIG